MRISARATAVRLPRFRSGTPMKICGTKHLGQRRVADDRCKRDRLRRVVEPEDLTWRLNSTKAIRQRCCPDTGTLGNFSKEATHGDPIRPATKVT